MARPFTALFDEVYLLAHKYPQMFRPALLRQLKSSRRFVLDDEMSAFLADIGWATYKTDPDKMAKMTEAERKARTEQIIATMENVRRLARLPHAATWIEWNEKPLAKRASEIYGSTINVNLVPEKSGWLLMQHPHIETAFQGLSFGYGSTLIGSEGNNDVGVTPFAMGWRSDDDGPLPWHLHPLTVDADGKALEFRGTPVSGVMSGMWFYRSGMIGLHESSEYILDPRDAQMKAVDFRRLMNEQAGMARYLLGLLATINDLPVGLTKVTTSKGFIAKGNYRKFLDHTVVSLKVPQTQYRALARKVVMGLRRRAHQVRGHWRLDWRKPEQRVWVREHVRGDTSLGFVVHDYEVSKG